MLKSVHADDKVLKEFGTYACLYSKKIGNASWTPWLAQFDVAPNQGRPLVILGSTGTYDQKGSQVNFCGSFEFSSKNRIVGKIVIASGRNLSGPIAACQFMGDELSVESKQIEFPDDSSEISFSPSKPPLDGKFQYLITIGISFPAPQTQEDAVKLCRAHD